MASLSIQTFTNIRTGLPGVKPPSPEKQAVPESKPQPPAPVPSPGGSGRGVPSAPSPAPLGRPVARGRWPSMPAGEPSTASGSVGVFLTPQSLVTFPVASTVVTMVWKVLAAAAPGWGTSNVTLLLIAFAVGFLIYAISLTANMSPREKLVGAAVAVFNCFFLAATALGIGTAVR